MGGAVNLTALLSNASRECWLALNEEQSKIVGRGETIREAVEEAKKNGVDDPIVLWSPKVWASRVGLLFGLFGAVGGKPRVYFNLM